MGLKVLLAFIEEDMTPPAFAFAFPDIIEMIACVYSAVSGYLLIIYKFYAWMANIWPNSFKGSLEGHRCDT